MNVGLRIFMLMLTANLHRRKQSIKIAERRSDTITAGNNTPAQIKHAAHNVWMRWSLYLTMIIRCIRGNTGWPPCKCIQSCDYSCSSWRALHDHNPWSDCEARQRLALCDMSNITNLSWTVRIEIQKLRKSWRHYINRTMK